VLMFVSEKYIEQLMKINSLHLIELMRHSVWYKLMNCGKISSRNYAVKSAEYMCVECWVVSYLFFTARCTLVQSAVLLSYVVRLSVRPSVRDV